MFWKSAKYIGETNGKRWEGFNASGIRIGSIDVCRLVNFKMTLAKLSIFVLADGVDIYSPMYQLIRIIGKSEKFETIGRTSTGVAMLVIRPMYFPWGANLRIRYDAGQFTATDVTNLIWRLGEQNGICEGRHNSKESAGQGWGCFKIVNEEAA